MDVFRHCSEHINGLPGGLPIGSKNTSFLKTLRSGLPIYQNQHHSCYK